MNSILTKITLLSIITLLFSSCEKDIMESNSPNKVTLSFINDSFNQNSANKASLSNPSASIEGEQIITTVMSNGLEVKATLTPNTSIQQDISISKKAMVASNTNTVTQELKENTKIKILIYDSNGSKFTEIDHIYKSNGPEIEIDNMLVGMAYTFIVYSINSKENIPEAQNKEKLSGLQINDLNTEFMYFKDVKTIEAHSNNNLNIKLKHQYSAISTVITIDQAGDLAGSKVTQMTAPTISPAYDKASFNLQTGQSIFQEASLINNGKELSLDQSAIVKNPIVTPSVFVMTNGDNSTLNINSITINNYTNSIKLEGFKINPGIRYTLKLEVACPCTRDVTQVNAISRTQYSDTASTFTYRNANYGVVLDIFDIDNSFNLTVNDSTIFEGTSKRINNGNQTYALRKTNEIQFQGYGLYPNTNLIPNIQFEDGSRWGMNNFSEIWFFKDPSNSKPIIRIIVSKDGNIQMYGSKNLTGGEPFYPLQLVNNQNVTTTEELTRSYYPYQKYNSTTTHTVTGKFKQFNWKSGANVIKLSQSRKDSGDATSFRGSITGKQIVKCTP